MKTATYFTTILVLFLSSCSEVKQEETPEAVLKSFNSMFPNAQEVEWELEEDVWEAEFTLDEHEVSAEFNLEGEWLETETELGKEQIPHAVASVISEKYPNCMWLGYEEVRKPEFMAYEIEIEFEGETHEILISGSGEILEEETESSNEEPAEEETKPEAV
ncbi:MAG: PepSY-like domain-containing protein [Schleiferiaceae bacterium]|jgi:hypothetical protein|nr:PepSY-like domain-containing protein [Schleiferiaceae bacterium]